MLSSKIKRCAQDSGFTLIELLVVISIISLLASVVLASLNSARGKARVARAASDLRELNTVLAFHLDNNKIYPCFDHAWDDTKEKGWAVPIYISAWPTNPWENQYHWEHSQRGFTFSISINAPGEGNQWALNNAIDNGTDMTTGVIRGDSSRVEYGGMDQSVPFIDCHI
jgi:prepilin-type N-terminal cleavage/methylation domain-containing protein